MTVKTIGALNVAGGAGKTPMTLWLAAVAARLYGEDIPVFVVDLDAQATLTELVAAKNDIDVNGQAKEFYEGTHIADCAQLVTMFNHQFWFVANDVSGEALDRIDTTEQLKAILSEYDEDFILVCDLPPRQSRVVENFVNVANGIYCPVTADQKGLNGFKRAVAMVETMDRYPVFHAIGTKHESHIRRKRIAIKEAREFSKSKKLPFRDPLPLMRGSDYDPDLELLKLFHDDAVSFLRQVIT